LNVEKLIGTAPNMTVTVLGLYDFKTNESSMTWNSLDEVLTPLKSGTTIEKISQNFIKWSSSFYWFTIAGHITGVAGEPATRMIDVTDYHKGVLARKGKKLTFLLYRPFRHSEYTTGAGLIEADDLSNGTRVRISGKGSSSGPELIQFSN
jgi:hypothetical protein